MHQMIIWRSRIALVLTLVCVLGCPFGIPILHVSPTAFSFDTNNPDAGLTVANIGAGTLTWSVERKPDWLTVTPASGTITSESRVLALEANLEGLAQGPHAGELLLRSNGGNRGIAVNATVGAAPLLEVSPTTPLDFGSSETLQTFTIRNAGVSLLEWDITQPIPTGFTASGLSGSLGAGDSETITVTVNRDLLGPDFQSASISITSNGGSHTVTLLATIQDMVVSPASLDFGQQLDQLACSIINNGTAPFDWTIDGAVLPAWVTLDPVALSGTLEAGAQYTITVTVDRTDIGAGTTQGQIRIVSDGGSTTVLVSIEGADPLLQVSPTELDFGSTNTTDSIQVRNGGTGTLVWSVEEGMLEGDVWTPGDIPWLVVDGPTSGEEQPGESTTVTVTVDRSQVTPDPDNPFVGHLRFISADGDEAIVAVSQQSLPPRLRATPLDQNFSTTYIRRQIAIWNGGLGAVNWRADTSGRPAWLSIEPVDAGGIASGSVAGEETDSLTLSVDRTGFQPADTDYAWSFDITATDGAGNPLDAATVNVSMNVARFPVIALDTGNEPDEDGVAYLNLGTFEDAGSFIISNEGTGTLTWEIDLGSAPGWLVALEPSQGTLEPLERTTVAVTVDRRNLSYGDQTETFLIDSNDPARAILPLRIELQVSKRVAIDVRPNERAMGRYNTSSAFEVANSGDPGSVLRFQIESNKPWLFFYPETGTSEGTSAIDKDWQPVDISIDRAQLDGSGATGILTIRAFEIDDNGQRVILEDVDPAEMVVSVEASPLSFEAAFARTRIPSLVRFVLLMRDIGFRALPLEWDVLDDYASSFAIFEKDEPVEPIESSQLLTSAAGLRTDVVILLDYSLSMYEAAQSVMDQSIATAPDPLQALYERCVGQLIDELPDSYDIALMEFHERSGTSRLVIAPDYGAAFVTSKTILHQRLESIAVTDHGATELLPAVRDAASRFVFKDFGDLRIPFDDGDVRALICVTDGRLTTPPNKVKETLNFLWDLRVRFFPIGWGNNVLHEPLARLGSGTGGHYYATRMENTGETDEFDNLVRVPIADELFNWCATEDPFVDPCDQSVAKDLRSQVVLSYVTLRGGADPPEESSVVVRVDAAFDDPNDDDGYCMPDQRTITGSFSQKEHDFEAIVGDVRLGQISMRTEGIQDSTARVVVRGEYIPRYIDEFEFFISSTEVFTITLVPPIAGGLLDNWTLTDLGGGQYSLAAPAAGEYLKYGAFGDMLYLDFPNVTAPSFVVSFEVSKPVYSGDDPYGKYFVCPDSITLDADGAFASAFPTPEIEITVGALGESAIDFGTDIDVAEFTIRNIGGCHISTYVWLDWEIFAWPGFVTVDPEVGSLCSTAEVATVTVTVDRTLEAGQYAENLWLSFGSGSLGTAGFLVPLAVYAFIQPPELEITSPDFTPDTNTLDFGGTQTEFDLTITNGGQSYLYWSVDADELPDWMWLTSTMGVLGPGESTDDWPFPITVEVSRLGLEPGDYTHIVTISMQYQYEGRTVTESQDVTVNMTVPAPGLDVSSEDFVEGTSTFEFGSEESAFDITLANNGYGQVEWRVDDSIFPGWLSVAPTSGALGEFSSVVVRVSVSRADMAPGAYTHDFAVDRVYPEGKETKQTYTPVLTITANMTVLEPVLAVTSDGFVPDTHTLAFGTEHSTLDMLIANDGQSTLNWTIDDSAFPDWLGISSNSGDLDEGENVIATVSVSRVAPAPGDYTYEFVVESAYGDVTVTVNMTVLDPVLDVSSADFLPGTYTLEFVDATTSRDITIANIGQSTLDWTIDESSFPLWLDVGPKAGSLEPDGSETVTLAISRDDTAAGNYTHNFTVETPYGDQVVTVNLTVLATALEVTSADFLPATHTLDFGDATTRQNITIANIGHGILSWEVDDTLFPAWLELSVYSGNLGPLWSVDARVTVTRTGLAPGAYTYDFTVESVHGNQVVTVNMSVP